MAKVTNIKFQSKVCRDWDQILRQTQENRYFHLKMSAEPAPKILNTNQVQKNSNIKKFIDMAAIIGILY
jgi:hypothetical protein